MISAIVLAAGTSSRMGQPKPLVRLTGRHLLEHVLAAVRNSRIDQIIVVLGHDADRVRHEVPLDGATVVVNDAYASGMSSSIRAGMRAMDPRALASFVVLGDQPFVSPSTLDVLIQRRATSTAKILVPTFRGTRGNPVLLDRSLFDAMQELSGDEGCRAIFPDHTADLLEVPVEDPGILLDLDTERQVERVRRAVEAGEPLESIATEIVPPRVHVHATGTPREGRPKVRQRVDILALAQDLRSRDEPFALATVVRAVRPTSGKPGYKAVVRRNRELIGWVGGSCTESAVLAEAFAAMRDGRPRLLRLSRDAGVDLPAEGVVEYVMECHSGGAMDIYIEPHVPRSRLLIVGDSPVAEALSPLGRLLDYRVVVLAPGARSDAFPEADEVVPDLDKLGDFVGGDTYAIVASMGKYDDTALRAIVASRPAYVGLVASRARARALLDGLRRQGVPPDAVDRVRNPAGLDISAKTPEEVALSIMAEITQVRHATPRELFVLPADLPGVPVPALDVVCGMEVNRDTPLRETHAGTTYYFCSDGCRSRFLAAPESFLP